MLGCIVLAHRLNNSVNGNPRYRLTVLKDDGNFAEVITMSDASCGYEVDNFMGTTGGAVDGVSALCEFELTRAGRVRTITKV